MQRKVKIAGVILLLLGIVVACRIGGEYLYDHINTEIETAGKTISDREKPVVVVDAGHGGGDPGKIGVPVSLLFPDISSNIWKKKRYR